MKFLLISWGAGGAGCIDVEKKLKDKKQIGLSKLDQRTIV